MVLTTRVVHAMHLTGTSGLVPDVRQTERTSQGRSGKGDAVTSIMASIVCWSGRVHSGFRDPRRVVQGSTQSASGRSERPGMLALSFEREGGAIPLCSLSR